VNPEGEKGKASPSAEVVMYSKQFRVGLTPRFPELFTDTSEHIRFFLLFFFSTFLVCFRAVDQADLLSAFEHTLKQLLVSYCWSYIRRHS